MKYWEIIADNLSKAGWSWGCVSALDCKGRTIWIVDAHGYGKRFIVRADELLTAFVKLDSAIRDCGDCARQGSLFFQNSPLSNQCVGRPFECGGASVSAPLFSSRYSWVRPVLAAMTPPPLEPRARG